MEWRRRSPAVISRRSSSRGKVSARDTQCASLAGVITRLTSCAAVQPRRPLATERRSVGIRRNLPARAMNCRVRLSEKPRDRFA